MSSLIRGPQKSLITHFNKKAREDLTDNPVSLIEAEKVNIEPTFTKNKVNLNVKLTLGF